MALPAFAGELLPERTTREAAKLLTVRHVGIALVLIALAPLIAHRLDVVTERAQEQGVALVLDAKLPPQDKLTLAPALLGGVEAERPRAGLEQALADHGQGYDGGGAHDLRRRWPSAPTTCSSSAVGDAFRIAFVIAGALALLGAAALAGRRRRPRSQLAAAAAARARAVLTVAPPARLRRDPRQATSRSRSSIAGSLQGPELPSTGGITGFLQDRALEALDTAACRYGSSREELVLALADDQAAQRFEQRHGVDPQLGRQPAAGPDRSVTSAGAAALPRRHVASATDTP